MKAALNLYEKDFYAWTQEQAKLIKKHLFDSWILPIYKRSCRLWVQVKKENL